MKHAGAILSLLLLLPTAPLSSLASSGDQAQAFVHQAPYQPVDPDNTWAAVNAALASPNPVSALAPTASLGPLPLATFALETVEPPLERVRYRLRYGVHWAQQPPAADPVPLSYVEVVRFNLGPVIREELLQALGEAQVAEEAHFGIGPHVAWRFVMQPVMGNRALLMAAGRNELSDAAAQHETCLGAPCLGTPSVIEAAAPWNEMTQETAPAPGFLPPSPEGLPSAASAINLLLGEVDSIDADAAPSASVIPDWAIESVVERNLGQDTGLEAAYRWGGLLDDSVAALWERAALFPGDTAAATMYRAKAYECARGPRFAPPGEFCP